MQPRPYRIQRVRQETHDTFTLELEPVDGADGSEFAPGQFNMLYVFGVGEVPISISGDPTAWHVAGGQITAFANLVPEYQKNETGLDLMRRRREVENGTMELLFTSLLEWAKAQGYARFSMGLAALTGIGEHTDDPRVEQALRRLSEYFKRFINFRGLHSFKEKFNPRWEPRYLVYPGTVSLPGIVTTLLRVHSDGNFLWNYLKK